ncbi:MAG TPA: efflux RND transporter periplasmic adaptor subunit [Steroidobacteraceae bacterium]|nr:efflux RND transporter periplasmic adaptor subunit [Steroidobacteraceae bacterium]
MVAADSPANRVAAASLRQPLLWLGAALVLAAIGGGLWWYLGRDHALRYVTARVTRGDIQRTVTMTGALNPVVTAQVGSYVSGNIKSWSCDYNTAVKVGQTCAVIDPLPFQVVVDGDEADVHTSEAQLAKDRVAAVNAKLIYAHDQKLISEGIVSQEQLDTDKSTVDQDLAQIDLDIATVASKKAALHAAQVNLAYTNIVSPVNGMVITRYIDVGQTVVSNLQSSTLFLIGRDMRKMQVDTNVSEADVGDVKPGQKSNFTVQAYPARTFQGTVRQIREGPITVQNVVTYDVVVDVDNSDFALFPGMTADAHIITAERTNVLRVPLPAIRFTPQGLGRQPGGERRSAPAGTGQRPRRQGRRAGPPARVWVLREGKLVPVNVQTGLDDGTLVEVTSDELRVGDVVVVNAVRPDDSQALTTTGNRAPGANAAPRGGGGFRL